MAAALFGLLFPGLVCLGANADARVDVQNAFSQVLAAGGFRGYAQGHMFGPELPPMAGDVEVVFPDRIHASTDDMEFVALGERAWIKAFGIWTAADRSMLPVTAFDMAKMRAAIASIREVRVDGSSRTTQCQATIYRFNASGMLPGMSAAGDVRAWICNGGGKPVRLEATDRQSGQRVILDFDWSRRPVVTPPND